MEHTNLLLGQHLPKGQTTQKSHSRSTAVSQSWMENGCKHRVWLGNLTGISLTPFLVPLPSTTSSLTQTHPDFCCTVHCLKLSSTVFLLNKIYLSKIYKVLSLCLYHTTLWNASSLVGKLSHQLVCVIRISRTKPWTYKPKPSSA